MNGADSGMSEAFDVFRDVNDPPRERGMRGHTTGFLYVIRESGDGGMVKIGWAILPSRRLRQLQGANPRTLVPVAAFRCTTDEERDIHGILRDAGWWVRGEWYLPGVLVSVQRMIEASPGIFVEDAWRGA